MTHNKPIDAEIKKRRVSVAPLLLPVMGGVMLRRSRGMLNAKNVIKALVVSVVLAVLLSAGSAVLFGSGVSVDPGLDWEKVNSMSYSQATAYISAHTKPMSGWQTLEVHVRWLAFVTPAFFALIGSLFVGCLALLVWVRNENAA